MGVGLELIKALKNNENDKIRKLLARLNSKTANEADGGRWTPLHWACCKNNVDAVSNLLAIPGINVNAQCDYGWTPVMYAAVYCSVEALRAMVDHPGVDLDLRDDDGQGLEALVGIWAPRSTEKSVCLEIIKQAREKREGQGGASNASGFSVPGKSVEEVRANVVQQYIEQIDTVNQEIEEREKRIRDGIEIKNVKRKSLEEKYNSERKILVMKTNQEQSKLEEKKHNLQQQLAALQQSLNELLDKNKRETDEINTKHENEKTMLEKTFKKEDEDNSQHLASLKEKTNQLTRDLRKLDLDPANDTASANIEAARDTLECPVCMEIMKPPTRIWMCSSSHLVCEACKNRLGGSLCPTCRTEPVNWRALMAEKFAITLFNN